MEEDNFKYNSTMLTKELNYLKQIYPFLQVNSAGKSVLGKDIWYVKIGNGTKEVFYSSAIHRK